MTCNYLNQVSLEQTPEFKLPQAKEKSPLMKELEEMLCTGNGISLVSPIGRQ